MDKEGYAKQIKVDPEADAEDAAIDEQILADFGAQMDKILQEIAGLNENAQYSPDPVNLQTGNFILDREDIRVNGGFPIVFKRFYNSIDNHLGVLGRNWHHNYEIILKEVKESSFIEVSVKFDDGHVEYYSLVDGVYTPKKGIFNTLSKTLNGYILTKEDKTKYYFNESGQLIKIKDRNDNETNLEYENNLLKTIKSDSGYLNLCYRDGKLTNVTDQANRIVKYSYKGNFLTSFTNIERGIYTYKYSEKGALESVFNPRGYKVVENIYDDKYRTIKQNFPDGGRMEYNYDDENLQTTLTQQDGSQLIYKRDELYRATETIYPDGSEKNTYNDINKVSEKKDKNNNVYKYDYSENGKLLKSTDPLGNSTIFTYDDEDNLTNLMLPNGGEIISTYDEKGNLIQSLSPLKRKTTFQYDERGSVIKTILPNEGEVEISYDKFGNITSLENAEGNITKYEYDNLNRVRAVTDPEGNTTKFYYTLNHKISCVINAEGKERTYEYNKSGSVTKLVDFDGSVTTYKYNAHNKLTEVQDPRGGITKYFYNQSWNMYKLVDPMGNETLLSYDEQHRLKSVKDPEGNMTQYSYDPNGNLIKIYNPNGSFSKFKYDELNRRVEIKDAKGAITKFSYDEMSNLVIVQDALSNVSEFSYNLEGELTSSRDPMGNIIELTYDDMGLVSAVKDKAGLITKYEYHKNGKLHKIIKESKDGKLQEETFEYNKNGQLREHTNPIGATTKYDHDALGRVKKIINALGYEICFKYDAKGNIITKIDENGNMTRYNYDLTGNLIEVIDALENSTKYSYNLINKLTTIEKTNIISNELSQNEVQRIITKYNYDKRGLPTEEIDPLGNITSYEYDSNGNVISKTDKAGMKTLYEYDPINLLNKITYHDGETVDFEYNELRQLTKMKDWLGENKLDLDPLGRITKYTDYRQKTTQYSWGANSEKQSIVYPDNSVVNYEYDNFGRLGKVVDGDGDITSYSYDGLNRLIERLLPSGSKTNYDYNPINQITKLLSTKENEFLDEFTYSYDKAGNKIEIDKIRRNLNTFEDEEGSGNFKYYYDPLNRLREVEINKETQKRYEYDPLGNRILEECFSKKQYNKKYEYNELNQLLKTQSSRDGETSFTYSETGNLENITYSDGNYKNFMFDSINRMSRVENSNGDSTDYTYNGFLQRVKTEINIKDPKPELPGHREINFILDITKPYNNLLMTEGENIPERRFTWGHQYDLVSSTPLNKNVIENNIKLDKLFYAQDELFSTLRLTNLNGKSKEIFSYDEFGVPNDPLKHSINYKDFGNVFGFTGYQFEEVSELWFAQARYHDGQNGRFVSEDILHGNVFNPLSLNRYLYCLEDPLKYVDFNGKEAHEVYPKNYPHSKEDVEAMQRLDEISRNQYKALNIPFVNRRTWDSIIDIYNNADTINQIANTYGVPREIIASIIYKEQTTQSIPDIVANIDTAIRGNTHSVGLGAIFPGTAREAWENYSNEFPLNFILPKTDEDLQFLLNNDGFNIKSIAVVLLNYAKELGYIDNFSQGKNLTLDQWKSIVARYNGTNEKAKGYAEKVFEYLPYVKELLDTSEYN